jgi:septal ring factor EnvC (AmiA/AmiB activator)
MKTRKSIITALLILFVCGLTFAQTAGGNAKDRANQNLQNFKTKLNLSETQSKKLEAILKDWANEVKSLRANNAEKATNAKLLQMKDELNKRIESILNAEQKIGFKKMEEEQNQSIQKMKKK